MGDCPIYRNLFRDLLTKKSKIIKTNVVRPLDRPEFHKDLTAICSNRADYFAWSQHCNVRMDNEALPRSTVSFFVNPRHVERIQREPRATVFQFVASPDVTGASIPHGVFTTLYSSYMVDVWQAPFRVSSARDAVPVGPQLLSKPTPYARINSPNVALSVAPWLQVTSLEYLFTLLYIRRSNPSHSYYVTKELFSMLPQQLIQAR